ncbi:hypothetical protein [Bacterioplanoides pacificum]|uniref:Uncharacterized protein n=1 Tax=Bacterioplanoides pacificum TaxID=1171596 RepID=A0ABV7VWK6_9GAMM
MDNFELFNLVSSLYNIHLLLGPVLLVLNVMLARRMFGRWLMVPFGLINSAFINLMPLLANINSHSVRPDDLMVVTLLVPAAFMIAYAVFYAFDFWGQFWLYLLMFMIFPWIRLMSFALQFMALLRPADGPDDHPR